MTPMASPGGFWNLAGPDLIVLAMIMLVCGQINFSWGGMSYAIWPALLKQNLANLHVGGRCRISGDVL
jgi:hypothetical protein